MHVQPARRRAAWPYVLWKATAFPAAFIYVRNHIPGRRYCTCIWPLRSQISCSKLRGMPWFVLSAPKGGVFDSRGIRQISAQARLPGSLLTGIKLLCLDYLHTYLYLFLYCLSRKIPHLQGFCSFAGCSPLDSSILTASCQSLQALLCPAFLIFHLHLPKKYLSRHSRILP